MKRKKRIKPHHLKVVEL